MAPQPKSLSVVATDSLARKQRKLRPCLKTKWHRAPMRRARKIAVAGDDEEVLAGKDLNGRLPSHSPRLWSRSQLCPLGLLSEFPQMPLKWSSATESLLLSANDAFFHLYRSSAVRGTRTGFEQFLIRCDSLTKWSSYPHTPAGVGS